MRIKGARKTVINPLTPGTFLPKMRFLDTLVVLVVLRQDLGQIRFNQAENAVATQQLALVATKIVVPHFGWGVRRNLRL